jgi:hypothetical protein
MQTDQQGSTGTVDREEAAASARAAANTFEGNGSADAPPPESAVKEAVAEIELGREQILGVEDVKIKRIYVPQWKGYVHLQTLTGAGRDEFEAMTVTNGTQTTENIRAKLLSRCLVDKDGALLFSQEDVEALGKKSAAAIALLYGEAAMLNFVTEKDVEDLAKNSERGATSTT